MTGTKKLILLLLSALIIPVGVHSQKSMTVDDLGHWRRISNQAISNDGKYVGCKTSSLLDDATIHIYKSNGDEIASYTPGDKFEFSSSSKYILVTKTTPKEILDSLKLKKTKKDKMPMNSLIIRDVSGNEEIIDSLKSYKLAENGEWLAYQRGRKDSTLYVRTLLGDSKFQYPAVKSYAFAKNSNTIYFITATDTLNTPAGLYTLNPENGNSVLIKEGTGEFKQTTFNEPGTLIAFLYCNDKKQTSTEMELWLAETNREASLIADRKQQAIPENSIISEHGKLTFSENNKRLFFGTAPEPSQKDTTLTEDYRPNVHVWTWNEHTLQTVQIIDKEKDLKKSYQAVYDITNKKILQLSTPELPEIVTGADGNSDYALLSTTLPYPVTSMWEGTQKRDYYSISLITGKRELLKEEITSRIRISPEGKYGYWYNNEEKSWHTYSFTNKQEYRITNPDTFTAWNEQNDMPKTPDSYGAAGWTTNDDYLLLYDRYDIFMVDPTGHSQMTNSTKNGRKEEICYRIVNLDKDEKSFDINKTYPVSAFDENKKTTAYYEVKFSALSNPKPLLKGNYKANILGKAKNADMVIFTTETFTDYPELRVADINFKKQVKLTNEGKQQNEFIWGTAELTSWTSLDGIPLQGIIYKPANFNPNKKYPMIVNFYERNSDNLYNYTMPQPHRSTVDYHLYTSNEYIVFVPDIRYKTGYPGESCYNCVMPGISHIIEKGYINEKAIAAQGHSWGGYQVAYLATRTNLFAAIESGAPVVNMFSAYGGIRWQTGLSRAFQYEHTQSRIGSTPWEAPLKYFENSPLFFMDKVETPILIMHNDNDGHVPWYQGIEYFIALRRLQKPAWLLNYTGEIHWPGSTANRMDFQKRMLQFFNHYLKGEPMPKWMKEGVKAVEKDFDNGLELIY